MSELQNPPTTDQNGIEFKEEQTDEKEVKDISNKSGKGNLDDMKSLHSSLSLSISEKPINIDQIYPLIDPSIKSMLGKRVKQAILPDLKCKVREELL